MNPNRILRYFLVGAWVATATLIMLLASGCSKKVYVPMESERVVYRTDTLRQMQVRYDSIFVRDSVALVMRNDTVFLTKYRDQFKYLFKTDTLYTSKTDSIYVYKKEPYPVEVIKEVARPLKWWQKTFMWMGVVALLAICYAIYRVARKYK